LPQRLLAITSSKPLAKPSQAGSDQLLSNHKPELAKAAISVSWLVASQAAATLVQGSQGIRKYPNVLFSRIKLY